MDMEGVQDAEEDRRQAMPHCLLVQITEWNPPPFVFEHPCADSTRAVLSSSPSQVRPPVIPLDTTFFLRYYSHGIFGEILGIMDLATLKKPELLLGCTGITTTAKGTQLQAYQWIHSNMR